MFGSIALAVAMVWLDTLLGDELLAGYPRLFGAGAEGSRTMLAAIAQSMITVAGVTFSITMVAVTQASGQYTSRILRNFMSDRGNQFVLGVLLGIFTYCLIVLRTIRGGTDLEFIPAVSTLVAFLLAILGIGVLIFFIHHIAESLQAEHLLARVARDTSRVIDRLFPCEAKGDERAGSQPESDERASAGGEFLVVTEECGYVQAVHTDRLHDLAVELNGTVRMERAVGDFVVAGEPLLWVASAQEPSGVVKRQLACAYTIAVNRSVHQDVEFGIRQIVDVALKALSPGINDTTTAIVSIDHLSALLARLAPREVDGSSPLGPALKRVHAKGSSFESFVDTAFDEIRRHGAENVNVLERLLSAIGVVGTFTTRQSRRLHLRAHVDRIAEVVSRSIPAAAERTALEQRCGALRKQLACSDSP